MVDRALFTSDSCEWETPVGLFNSLNKVYRFTLDVCATRENAKCEHYFTKEDDALVKPWGGRCWMNPPYGREISKWVAKASNEVNNGNVDFVVALLPARTDTAWWQGVVIPSSSEIHFISGRLKFGNSKNSAPFPSALVVFRVTLWQAAYGFEFRRKTRGRS